jgi:hypothetical protein
MLGTVTNILKKRENFTQNRKKHINRTKRNRSGSVLSFFKQFKSSPVFFLNFLALCYTVLSQYQPFTACWLRAPKGLKL